MQYPGLRVIGCCICIEPFWSLASETRFDLVPNALNQRVKISLWIKEQKTLDKESQRMDVHSLRELGSLLQCDIFQTSLKRTEVCPATHNSKVFLGQAVANARVT